MAIRRLSRGRHLAVAALAPLLGLAVPLRARGAEIRMSAPAQGCGPVASGTETCPAAAGSYLDVLFALDASQSLNGYDLEIRWDATELTLDSATQLHPDTGTPEPFDEAPSDPADSRAAVFVFDAAETTQLFELRFQVSAGSADGQADLWWFPNGNGLAPGSVALDNPAGAALDVGPAAPLPALGVLARAGVGLLLALTGGLAARSRRGARIRPRR